MPTITQAGIVTSSLTNVPASSYSFVTATTTHFTNASTKTISITTHAVGNLLVSMAYAAGDTTSPSAFTAPSSANSTGWADSGEGAINAYNGALSKTTMWFGKATAVNTATLTIPYTSGTVGQSSCLTVLEFTCPGVDIGTVWSIDAHGNIANAAVLNPLYPFLSPTPTAQSPELYVGNLTGAVGPGNTAGFSYTGAAGDAMVQAFNPAITTPIAPNSASSGSAISPVGIAALFKSTIAHAIFDNIRIYLQPVPTGRMWIISQIGFEFLPANTLQTITANIVLNGRVIKPGVNPNGGQFQGPPYVTVRAGDTMWVDLFGVPVGASAIANFLYNEYSAYAVPHDLGGVV